MFTLDKKNEFSDGFLGKFHRCKNRPLRILHIGNIANNAYINSKIMRKNGIQADVLCYDYYHIMGCPEWEECNIDKKIDHHFPDFSVLDLKGYKRPEWFIQGPRSIAIWYLIYRNEKKQIRAVLYYHLLNLSLKLISKNPTLRHLIPRLGKALITVQTLNIVQLFKNIFLNLHLVIKSQLLNLSLKLISKNPTLGHLIPRLGKALITVQALYIVQLFKNIFLNLHLVIKSQFSKKIRTPKRSLNTLPPSLQEWKRLFEYYDIIQGYAIDAVWPQQVGFQFYAAYEHGTIKALPFLDNNIGHLCREVYTKAPLVFSTNTDSYSVGKHKLNIDSSKIHPLPHAFESSKALNFFSKNYKSTIKKKKKTVFIAPARHHWKEGVANLWHKGNNVIIDAIKLLSSHYKDFKVIFVSWGAEVQLSKSYIDELAVSSWIEWIPPVSKAKLWEYYMTSAGVIDQFVTPALGSVGFEAFALAAPLLTSLCDNEVIDFFGEMPPIYNCKDANTLAQSMLSVLNNPVEASKRGKELQQWLIKYHSEERILQIQLDAYSELLFSNEA